MYGNPTAKAGPWCAALQITHVATVTYTTVDLSETVTHIYCRCLDGPTPGREFCINWFLGAGPFMCEGDGIGCFSFWNESELVPISEVLLQRVRASPGHGSGVDARIAQRAKMESALARRTCTWRTAAGDPAVIAALERAQADPDEDVRLRAGLSLARFADAGPDLIDWAIGTLDVHPLNFDTLAAIKILGAAGEPAVQPILRSIAQGNRNCSDRIETLGAIGPAARPQLDNILAALAKGGNLSGPWAAEALAKIDAGESLRRLLPLLDDHDTYNEAGEVIIDLAKTAAGVAPAMIAKLHSPDPRVRSTIACAMQNLADPPQTTLPPLVGRTWRDPDPEVRQMAIWSLTEIAFRSQGSNAARQNRIEPLLQDPVDKVRPACPSRHRRPGPLDEPVSSVK